MLHCVMQHAACRSELDLLSLLAGELLKLRRIGRDGHASSSAHLRQLAPHAQQFFLQNDIVCLQRR